MSAIPWTVCSLCLRPAMLLVDPAGDIVHVDPEPTIGGPLIVNGVAGRIVGYHRRPTGGTRYHDPGWWEHAAVCTGSLPPRRPDPPLHTPSPQVTLRPPARDQSVVRVDGRPGSRRQHAPR